VTLLILNKLLLSLPLKNFFQEKQLILQLLILFFELYMHLEKIYILFIIIKNVNWFIIYPIL